MAGGADRLCSRRPDSSACWSELSIMMRRASISPPPVSSAGLPYPEIKGSSWPVAAAGLLGAAAVMRGANLFLHLPSYRGPNQARNTTAPSDPGPRSRWPQFVRCWNPSWLYECQSQLGKHQFVGLPRLWKRLDDANGTPISPICCSQYAAASDRRGALHG